MQQMRKLRADHSLCPVCQKQSQVPISLYASDFHHVCRRRDAWQCSVAVEESQAVRSESFFCAMPSSAVLQMASQVGFVGCSEVADILACKWVYSAH
jgi:hypothetical protein